MSSFRSSYMVTEGPLLLSAASDVSEYALLALGLAVRLTTPVEDFALVLVFGTAVIVDTAPVGNLSLSILSFGVMSFIDLPIEGAFLGATLVESRLDVVGAVDSLLVLDMPP